MEIWVTGGNGMLAKAIQLRLVEMGIPFISTGREIDICNCPLVHNFVNENNFTHIINCAAYNDVDGAESDWSSCYNTNAFGPGNLALSAATCGAKLIHFSTNYVFSGVDECVEYTTPYNPISAYGVSKKAGEVLVASMMRHQLNDLYVIRTSWLFGYGGSKNFVSTMLKLMAKNEVLRVVNDQFGRPTFADDLADAALELAGIPDNPHPYGIYHFANTGVMSWYEFAQQILDAGKRNGLPLITKEIQPVTTDEFPLPAQRPAHAVLNTSRYEQVTGKVPRDVSEALNEYIRNLT